MRFSCVAVSALLLSACSVFAGEPVIVVLDDGGAWYNAGDGSETVFVQRVIMPPGTPPGGGAGNGGGGGGNGGDLQGMASHSFKCVQETGDGIGALLLATVFETLRDGLKNGTIPATRDAVDKAMSQGVRKALGLLPDEAKADDDEWLAAYRKHVADPLAVKILAGEPSRDQWVSYMASIAEGFREGADALPAELQEAAGDWLQILVPVLLRLLEELLRGLFGG